MSIKTDKVIINSTLYITTWKDDLFNDLYQFLFNEELLQDLTDTGIEHMEYGKDFMCDFTQLFLYQELIQYLILLKDEINKITTIEEYIELVEGLLCVRKNFFCKYLDNRIFDGLLAIAGIDLKLISFPGLDFMILEGTGDNAFIIP